MNVLLLNCGSSSLRFQVIGTDVGLIATGGADAVVFTGGIGENPRSCASGSSRAWAASI